MADKISYIARKFIEEDVPFVIAKVIATKGSAPRKRDAVLRPFEKPAAQRVLQALKPAAHGRLRKEQLGSRFRDVFIFSHISVSSYPNHYTPNLALSHCLFFRDLIYSSLTEV